MRPSRTALLACSASFALVAGSALAASTPAGAAPVEVVFAYNGTTGADGEPQAFVVPDGVCQVTVEALGAAGGRGGTGSTPAGPGGDGGLGGRVLATVAVTPGETLTVRVGGAGGDGEPEYVNPDPTGLGGFNGGGKGGAGGGGGGGASDVRQGGDGLADRVVVAGGAGGGGFDGLGIGGDVPGGAGGAGGGEVGGAGGDGGRLLSDAELVNTGGGGGTQTEGGAPGQNDPDVAQPTAGALGQGGLGGAEGSDDADGGGGGGGGLFGGGGGGGGYAEPAAAGGGGGSGFGPAGSTFEPGVRAGHGQVTITYDLDAGGCPVASTTTTTTTTTAPVPSATPVAAEPSLTG